MKTMSVQEIDLLVGELNQWKGACLNKVLGGSRELGLELKTESKSNWLWVDLNPNCPVAFLAGERSPFYKKVVKPIHLFLIANAEGETLETVQRIEKKGRCFGMIFGGDCHIEVRLFPHGQNILVKKGGKKISFLKPKDLVAVAQTGHSGTPRGTSRSGRELLEEWQGSRGKKPESKAVFPGKTPGKMIGVKLELELKKKMGMKWKEVGEILKARQSLQVPDGMGKYVDPSLSLAENIQMCFHKSKQVRGKIERIQTRIRELQKEQNKVGPKPLKLDLKNEGVRTRKMTLEDGTPVYVGKSAKDNLAVLRSARPWDYWVHLKNFPGAHGVIRRNRGKAVSDTQFQEVGNWLAKESQAKRELRNGDFFEIQIAECRFVRPLKGDRLGRVTVQRERVVRVRFKNTP